MNNMKKSVKARRIGNVFDNVPLVFLTLLLPIGGNGFYIVFSFPFLFFFFFSNSDVAMLFERLRLFLRNTDKRIMVDYI